MTAPIAHCESVENTIQRVTGWFLCWPSDHLTTNCSAHARGLEAAARGDLSGEMYYISKRSTSEIDVLAQHTEIVRLPKRAETHRPVTDGLRIPDCVVFDDVKEVGQVSQISLFGWEEDRGFLILLLVLALLYPLPDGVQAIFIILSSTHLNTMKPNLAARHMTVANVMK